jgi:ParB-like chromosome segregation protein Spo0J
LSNTGEGQEPNKAGNRPLTVPISSLLPADSPRLAGENTDHVLVLADLADSFPPIIVQHKTYRVIDGMHRLRAAALRGQHEIDVIFYEGDDADAFVLAVQANIAHGLPLSHADRSAAAVRIMSSHPDWSDRKIASVAGLSHRTVGQLRTAERIPQQEARIGRDGRVRPLDSESTRVRIGELLKERPEASLREIAKVARASPTTVANVRERLRDGTPPALQADRPGRSSMVEQKAGTRPNPVVARETDPARLQEAQAALQVLRTDPSLRFNAAGRFLLHQLNGHLAGTAGLRQLTDLVPAHCAHMVAALANEVASTWREFAKALERRSPPARRREAGS